MLPRASIADRPSGPAGATCPGPQRRASLGALALVWALIGVVWGAVLPAIAVQPGVSRQLRELERRGIDASAMFYSELPCRDEAARRLDRVHRQTPDPLWKR